MSKRKNSYPRFNQVQATLRQGSTQKSICALLGQWNVVRNWLDRMIFLRWADFHRHKLLKISLKPLSLNLTCKYREWAEVTTKSQERGSNPNLWSNQEVILGTIRKVKIKQKSCQSIAMWFTSEGTKSIQKVFLLLRSPQRCKVSTLLLTQQWVLNPSWFTFKTTMRGKFYISSELILT